MVEIHAVTIYYEYKALLYVKYVNIVKHRESDSLKCYSNFQFPVSYVSHKKYSYVRRRV